MHVRGSSLSQPRVVEALRPFIVAFWGQANNEPIPEDQVPLYEASGRVGSNVRCFVLDSGGQLRHSFNGFPVNAGNPLAFSQDAYTSYFAGEINRGAAGLTLPNVEAKLKVPDARDGVRLFIRLPDQRGSYSYPVVETVENRDEWKTLAYPDSSRQIEASRLSRWLRLCYPAGVNEQLAPFKVVKGTLTFTPAGARQAILSGKIKLANSETDYDLFEGTFEAVVTYPPAPASRASLRGVVDGIFWRFDRPHNQWMEWRLTTSLESRPK
jgi:hypothetical protein